MATPPSHESIDTFIAITGLHDTLAIQILQEHGGDINRAVNAHFNDGDRAFAQGASAVAPLDDFMDIDEPVQADPHESSTNLNQPSLSNPGFHGQVFDSASEFTNRASFVSLPTDGGVLPIEVKSENGLPSQSGQPATTENATARLQAHVTIVIGDEDDEVEIVTSAQSAWDVSRPEPSAPVLNSIQELDLGIEEEMIRAAIEASKREAEGVYSSQQFGFHNRSEGSKSQFGSSDPQIASSSFQVIHGKSETKTTSPVEDEIPKTWSQNERLEVEDSSIQGYTGILGNDNETRLRQRARHFPSGSVESSTEVVEGVVSPPSSPGPHQHSNVNSSQMRRSENGFPADEWGGISPAEHDEAVMLEAAMFGGIPETSEYNAFAARRLMPSNLNDNLGPYMIAEPHPPSPNLTAQRQLREQQDDEYHASLQADIEKAEACRLEEQAVRDAAREEEKRKEEESLRKLEDAQELDRQLVAKEASIPQEPSPDEVNAVNLLIRMPDGSRRGRRFLKSDRLQSLFDYIDIGRVVKPDTYRLVRPYPRRAFGVGDDILTLSELGLTSKQEALYLELV